MIDVHSHCLPALDDGAKDVSESIDMLVNSFAQGVERCICTPHAIVHSDRDIVRLIEKRSKSIEQLKEGIAQKQASVPELHYGFEVFLDNDISVYDNVDKLCIENTRYMLVEMSFTKYNEKYAEWLYSLSLKGIVPILAHVERYTYFNKLFGELGGFDVVYQINAGTLLKSEGKKLLNELYDYGCNVVCGSDMHNMLFRRSKIGKAFQKIDKLDSRIAKDVFKNTAKQIIGV
ncbi:MAG: hypothetical protein E7593_05030 [Ruminococcaceae bacterium]|nr:hypothetical protein [Oscillospiraceae bacterium]